MSIIRRIASVLTDASTRLLHGITDVEFALFGSDTFLYVGSEVGSSVTAYRVTDPAAPAWLGTAGFSATSGTAVLSDIEIYSAGGTPHLLTLGRYDDEFGHYALAPDGRIGAVGTMTDTTGLYARGWVSEVATARNGTPYAFTAAFGRSGFEVFSVAADGMFTHLRTIDDGGFRKLGDVTAILGTDLKGSSFVFAASALDAGIHAYFLTNGGNLWQRDKQVPRDPTGSGFNAITEMVAVEMDDRAFLVAGGAGSDTLSVFRVSWRGVLTPVDEMWDTLATRFEGITALELIETTDRTILVAGGADDGLTFLELTWNGRLVLLDTLWDDFTITLSDISDIEATGAGDLWTLAVASSTEHGLTLIDVDFSRSGVVTQGGAVAETLTGTTGDDEIWGRGRSDLLDGGAGDDRLVDGRGRDRLTGGPGADTFVFIPDGRSDWIEDFDLAEDRIDLSEFDRIYDISAIEILPRLNGAVIFVGSDIIRVTNPAGGPFDVTQFDNDHFVFG